MIKNLFSQLPGLKHLSKSETEAQEADELQAKKDRIEFHRKHVRNGPVKGRPATNGQIRRQRVRDAAREARKNYEQQVRAFHASQHELALLRSHLQRVGVVRWGNPDFQPTAQQVERSIVWLLENFPPATYGVVEENIAVTFDPTELASSIQQAYDRYAALTGQPARKIELNPEIFAA